MVGLGDKSVPWPEISRYMLRGRVIVGTRQPDAVNWGNLIIDWAMNEILPELASKHPSLLSPQPIEPESPLIALMRVREHIAIGDMSHFPNATWAELFACFGIGRIGQAHVSLQRKRDLEASGVAIHPKLIEDLDGRFLDCLFEAMEAIQIAERLGEIQGEASTKALLILSSQQREKALKRHAATSELQDRFEAFYVRQGGGNKTQAARDFLETLDADDRKKLTIDDDNAIRTLTRGLLRRRRGPASGNEH